MASTRFATLVFAATMGLAGFLLFQIQPVMAKYILPWFGGSATTWIVCMLFFQVALLVGYAYAYAVTRPFTLKTQVALQIGLLLLALVILPITPSDTWKPTGSDNPTGTIIALLTVSAGLPYAVLATTSPLLQRWLTRMDAAIDVSRLFAVSNFGSFLGLLSYPFVFERVSSSREQTVWWSWAFVVYAALFSACAFIAIRRGLTDEGREREADPVSHERGQRDGSAPFFWIAYAALGSVLLLATTNQITQWSAVVPFLWVAPLSLYLLTFVIAFGNQHFYDRTLYTVVFFLLSATTFVLFRPDTSADLVLQIGLQCATLFSGCMICHAEMVRLKPEPRRLPGFYLATAMGGALGGIVVALVAPLVFSDYWEHPATLAVIAVSVFLLVLRHEAATARWIGPAAVIAGLVFIVSLSAYLYREIVGARDVVARVRNFYGVVKVVKTDADDAGEASVVMQQAGVDQGSQFLTPARRAEPACAFNAASGVGQAILLNRKRREKPDAPIRIGIVGLGAGMVAVHGRAGDLIRYYELNPAVADLADRHFSFVRDTPAKVEIVLGDGRLILEREALNGGSQRFDVIVMNAFRGASPPMHLMTQEAYGVYLKHLEPDGILAVNFELDTFEMAPLHRGLAAASGLTVNWVETPESEDCDDPVSWALYTRDSGFWSAPPVKAAISPWRDGATSRLVWTDRDSNLMSIIDW